MPVAAVVIQDLDALVDALEGVSLPDIVTMLASIGSLVVAAVLLWLTFQYRRATDRIAEANEDMADASRVIAEMKKEREQALELRSHAAANRLGAALFETFRQWERAPTKQQEDEAEERAAGVSSWTGVAVLVTA